LVDAATALEWGFVTEVVDHEGLMARCLEIARSIASIDPAAVTAVRETYEEVAALSGPDAYAHERRRNAAWMRERYSDEGIDERVSAVIERGSSQV
jgi:enoyl-CoA hydratase/carnithine racemase